MKKFFKRYYVIIVNCFNYIVFYYDITLYQGTWYYSNFGAMYVTSYKDGIITNLLGTGDISDLAPQSIFIDTTGMMYVADLIIEL